VSGTQVVQRKEPQNNWAQKHANSMFKRGADVWERKFEELSEEEQKSLEEAAQDSKWGDDL